MFNLFFRSMMVLALLFGLLFAVGMAVVFYFGLPPGFAALFALVVVFLQYLLGPWIIELIYKIQWKEMKAVDPSLGQFVENICAAKSIPLPRFGVIEDGNPNAFTFGHYPRDARLVVTSGLLGKLNQGEVQAVVAHELGHIAHWDFVVMTVAAVVPLLLYVLYMATRMGSRTRRRGKSGGAVALIALLSYIAYIVSHYIVLLLSRVREYYADQFSGQVTENPEALSTALVKVAYGLASQSKGEVKNDTRMIAARSLGIFDPKAAQTLALAGAASGTITADTMANAMKWDLWNPWAGLYELSSSHPLPAKRMRALERQVEGMGRLPRFNFRLEKPESYWDEFLVDLFANYLPLLGFLVGSGLAAVLVLSFQTYTGALGALLLTLSFAWLLKRWFSYHHDFRQDRTVHSLVDEVKVSAVRSIPCTVEGEIIGRGVPGLFYSEDLVLRDNTGFIVVDYRQPLRIFEFLFGWLKAEQLIGQRGKVMGWYRRAPRPYIEMRKLVLDNGKTVTSYLYPLQQAMVYIGLLLGILLIGIGFLI